MQNELCCKLNVAREIFLCYKKWILFCCDSSMVTLDIMIQIFWANITPGLYIFLRQGSTNNSIPTGIESKQRSVYYSNIKKIAVTDLA